MLLREAVGLVAAELVTCYPPGIPIICPGEVVTPDIVSHLELVAAAGLRVSGPGDPTLRTLRVLG